MSIWSSLFASENVVNKMADGLYNGLDAAVYTTEEKVENRKEFYKLYEPFKKAQRLLAMTICPPYMLAWSVTFILSFTGLDITKQEELLSGNIGTIVQIIIAFYFLGGVANGFSVFTKKDSK